MSIERQVSSAREYAAARGWKVALVASDDGVSATKHRPEDRRGWRTILDSTEHFEAVIIWKVDRCARRVLDFLRADEALQARGAAIVAVADPVDMTTAQGRAFTTMLSVFAEMEAAAMSARITAARHALIKAGRRPGGRAPYGYRNIPNPDGPGVVLAQDPETIDVARRMVAMAQEGIKPYSIARRLESEGIKPRRRKDSKAPDYWHEANVNAILRSPWLAGMVPFTPGRRPGDHKSSTDFLRDADGMPVIIEDLAIITPAERRDLIALLDSTRRPGSRPSQAEGGASRALLYGIARCANCDSALHKAQVTSKGNVYTYYRCQGVMCKHQLSITRPGLDRYITEAVLRVAGNLPVISIETVGSSPTSRLAEIEAAITDTARRLAEVDDEVTEADLAARLRSLKRTRRIAREEESIPVTREIDTGKTFREVFEAGTVDEQREAIRSALEVVYVLESDRKGHRHKFDGSRVQLIWRNNDSRYW